MATRTTTERDREERFGEIVFGYLQAAERGEPTDRRQLLSQHPEFAAELEQFLGDVDGVGRLATPILALVHPTHAATSALSDGGTLGDYRLIREVGRGGMGVVYEAEQISLRRRVALKVLPWAAAMDPKQLQRFKNEALAAASLKHDHIVSVYAVGCERGVHYYAMEFIEGQTLAQLIGSSRERERPEDLTADFPPVADAPGSRAPDTAPIAALTTERSGPRGRKFHRRAAELIADAADALEHAHALGIVHRDIKPGNLLLDANGRIYVSDFGLARFGPDAGLTMSGDLVGTLRYMSPEQALARHGLVDHRADIYSLGATLYELLTLRPAVRGDDKGEILRAVAWEESTPPRKLDKSIPVELETITLKCLAKEPGERYASARELSEDLRRWLGNQAIKAKTPGWRLRTAKWGKRHVTAVWVIATIGLVTVVAVTVIAGFAWHKSNQLNAAYADAEQGRQLARRALDDMSSQVIDVWFAQQTVFTKEQRAFLNRSLSYYQELADEAGDSEATRASIAAAYQRVGQIQKKLGPLSDSEIALRRSRDQFEMLATDFPENPIYIQSLAATQLMIGQVLEGIRRLPEAEESFRTCLELRERLAAHYPNSPEYLDEQAQSCLDLCSVLKKSKQRSKAERFQHKALTIAERLTAAYPTSDSHQLLLAKCYLAKGNILQETGRWIDAEKTMRDTVTLLAKLAEKPTSAPVYRSVLAAACNGLGGVLFGLDRFPEAVQCARKSLSIQQKFADEFPGVPDYRDGLANEMYNLAIALNNAGHAEDSEKLHRQALALREKLADSFPDIALYRHGLAESYLAVGKSVLDLPGRVEEAVEAMRHGVELLETLATEYPRYLPAVATSLKVMGDALTNIDRKAAEKCLRRCVAINEGLAADFPDKPQYRSHQAGAYLNLGNILRVTNRWSEAENAYRKSLGLRERLAREVTDNLLYRRYLGLAQNNLASVLANCPDLAMRDVPKAVELANQAVGNHPENSLFWSTLGIVRYRAGDWKNAIAAIEKATEQSKENNVSDWFCLAMAHWQLGERDKSRQHYAEAAQWMEKEAPNDEDLRRIRAEAAQLLEINK